MSHIDFDLIIIGGGMVGASLACALSEIDMKIGIVEANDVNSINHTSYDDRSLVIAQGTKRILKTIGIWQPLESQATPIKIIKISDGKRTTQINYYDETVDYLGYVIGARVLGTALMEKLLISSGITILCPAQLEIVQTNKQGCRLIININGISTECTAKLVVAADGAYSVVRKQLGIKSIYSAYGQSATITTLTTSKPHEQIAYEHFDHDGMIALLPLLDQYQFSVIWTRKTCEITDIDNKIFRKIFLKRFGNDFCLDFPVISKSSCYPLFLMQSLENVRQRAVILGNAAHTLHPVAGQGFNLSIRDIAALAEIIAGAWHNKKDIGNQALLQMYNEWRYCDQIRTVTFTDILARLFVNTVIPARIIRVIGLSAFNLASPLKHLLAKQCMGLLDTQLKLVRGVPLNIDY